MLPYISILANRRCLSKYTYIRTNMSESLPMDENFVPRIANWVLIAPVPGHCILITFVVIF